MLCEAEFLAEYGLARKNKHSPSFFLYSYLNSLTYTQRRISAICHPKAKCVCVYAHGDEGVSRLYVDWWDTQTHILKERREIFGINEHIENKITEFSNYKVESERERTGSKGKIRQDGWMNGWMERWRDRKWMSKRESGTEIKVLKNVCVN